MVDQGQGDDEVGCGAAGEGSPLGIAETTCRCGMGKVNAEREDMGMMIAIKLVDTLPVGINGHHRYPRVGEYLREPAVVTAKVQGIGEFDVLKVLAEELLFSFEILLAKDRLIVVVTPRGGLFWGGVQAGDGR